jgi:neutral ceramidase
MLINLLASWQRLTFGVMVLIFCDSTLGDESKAMTLRIGTAAVDITPRLGTPMAGYYTPRGADGIHDPLFAKAVVLDDGETKLAIVSLDLIKTTHAVVDQARKLIADRMSLPPDAVMISATHSHTGPVLPAGSPRDNDFGGTSSQVGEYVDKLPQWIAQAVEEADKELRSIEASMTTGRCEGIAFNRRFHMQNGKVAWNAGKLNPLIVRPAGPVDEDLPMLLFTNAKGDRQAALLNYSIHLDTVGGTEFSADIPGHVSRMLTDAVSPDFFTLYLTACCGDVNHIDVSRGGKQKGHEESTRIATLLAAETLRAFEQTKPLSSVRLSHASQHLQLPPYPVTDDDIETARRVIEKRRAGIKPEPSFRELVAAYRAIDIDDRKRAPWNVEVQVFAIGNQAAIVSLPGEIFVELGMSIRQGSPFPVTCVAELANGSIGYIPNRVAYPQGEYEVLSARCAQGSGEMLVDAALEMLSTLYRNEASSK